MLEEFGIESAEELKSYLKSLETINDYETQDVFEINNLKSENEELKSQLSKAIVPKFGIGEEVYGIVDRFAYTGVIKLEIVEPHLVYEVDDGEDITVQNSSRIFKTEAEAQAKLDEIRRKL